MPKLQTVSRRLDKMPDGWLALQEGDQACVRPDHGVVAMLRDVGDTTTSTAGEVRPETPSVSYGVLSGHGRTLMNFSKHARRFSNSPRFMLIGRVFLQQAPTKHLCPPSTAAFVAKARTSMPPVRSCSTLNGPLCLGCLHAPRDPDSQQTPHPQARIHRSH